MKAVSSFFLFTLAFLCTRASAAPRSVAQLPPPRGTRAVTVTDDGHVGVGTDNPNVLGVGGRWLSVIGKTSTQPGFLGLGTPVPVMDSGGIAGGVNFFNGSAHAGEIQANNSTYNTIDNSFIKVMTRTNGKVVDAVRFGGPGDRVSSYVAAGESCRVLKGDINIVYDAAGGSGDQATFPNTATGYMVPFRSSVTSEAGTRTTDNLIHFFHNRAGLGAGHEVNREVAFLSDGKASGGTVHNFAVVADNSSFTGDYFLHSNSDLPSQVSGVATFTGQLVGKGTATDDNAHDGYIGEYLEDLVTDFRPVPGASGVYGDGCSLNLTPGDWTVTVMAYLTFETPPTDLPRVGISRMSGQPTDLITGINAATVSGPITGGEVSIAVPGYRVSLQEPARVIQKIEVAYDRDPPQYRCRMSARRMR